MGNYSRLNLKYILSPSAVSGAPVIGTVQVSDIPDMVTGYLNILNPAALADNSFVVAATGKNNAGGDISVRFHSRGAGILFNTSSAITGSPDLQRDFISGYILPTLLIKAPEGEGFYDMLNDYVSASQIIYYSGETPIVTEQKDSYCHMLSDGLGNISFVNSDSRNVAFANRTLIKSFKSKYFVQSLKYDEKDFVLKTHDPSLTESSDNRSYKYLSLNRTELFNDMRSWLDERNGYTYRFSASDTETRTVYYGGSAYYDRDENKVVITSDEPRNKNNPASVEIVSTETITEPHNSVSGFIGGGYNIARNNTGKIKITTGVLGGVYTTKERNVNDEFSIGGTIYIHKHTGTGTESDPDIQKIDIVAGDSGKQYYPTADDLNTAKESLALTGPTKGNIKLSVIAGTKSPESSFLSVGSNPESSFLSVGSNIVIKSTETDGTVFIYKQSGKYYAVSIGDIVQRLFDLDGIELASYTEEEIKNGFIDEAGDLKSKKARIDRIKITSAGQLT